MVESFETSCGFHPIAEAENNLDQKAPDPQGIHAQSTPTFPSLVWRPSPVSKIQKYHPLEEGRPRYSSACSLTTLAVAANNAAAASSVGVDVIHENSFRSMAGNIDLAPSVATVPGCNESDMVGFVPAGAAFSKRR